MYVTDMMRTIHIYPYYDSPNNNPGEWMLHKTYNIFTLLLTKVWHLFRFLNVF